MIFGILAKWIELFKKIGIFQNFIESRELNEHQGKVIFS
jgi:hypothetical protein